MRGLTLTYTGAVALVVSIIGILCAYTATAESAPESDSPAVAIESIVPSKFQSTVLDSREAWIVSFVPTGYDFEDDSDDIEAFRDKMAFLGVKFGSVECKGKSKICANLPVPGKVVYVADPEKNPYTGKNFRTPMPYSGPPDLDTVARFVGRLFPAELVNVLSSDQVSEGLAADADASKIVFFTEKDSVVSFTKTIAYEFRGKAKVYQVSQPSEEVLASFGISSVPALAVSTSPGNMTLFGGDEGALKQRPLISSWIKSILPEASAEETTPDGDSSTGTASAADDVPVNIRDESLRLSDLAEDKVWVIGTAYSTESFSSAGWKKVESWCEGAVEAVRLTCASTPESPQEGAEALGTHLCAAAGGKDTTFIVPYGAIARKKLVSKAKLASVPFDDFEPIKKGASDALPDDLVSFLPDDYTMQSWLMTNNQNNKLSAILMSNKENIPPTLKNLAVIVRDFAEVGFMNPDANLQANLGNQKLPTITCMFLTTTPGSEMGQMQATSYDPTAFGPMRLASMHHFIMYTYGKTDYTMPEPDPATVKPDVQGKVQTELAFISSPADWDAHCGGSFKGICAIGFYSGGDSSEGVVSALMKSTMKAIASPLYRFMVVDGSCYTTFAEDLDVQAGMLPTAVAYSPAKQRYASFRGSFLDDEVKSFFDGVLSGKTPTVPLSGGSHPTVTEECTGAVDVGADDIAEEDASDFLAEIQREEAERAKQLKKEVEEERQRLADEKNNSKKKKKSSKKKKKSKKSGDDEL